MDDPYQSQSEQNEPAQQFDEPQLYTSPVIEAIPEGQRPSPLPACGTCPLAMWYEIKVPRNKGPLQCFCSKMHRCTWDGKEAPVMHCDGRELALEALQAQINQ